jgi:hypothetical protein
MAFLSRIPRRAGRLVRVVTVALTSVAHAIETLAVKSEVVGTTPVALGYNLGQFEENSNAADWFRYSGADSARLFVARKDLEKTDDKAPWGDGVVDQTSFFARRDLLRANAANPAEGLSHEFVDWHSFSSNLAKSYGYPLATLRDAGVDVLATITAGESLDPNDWAGRWELWQHYYAAAYVMSHKYNVRRYSMYNEPNHGNKMNDDHWLDLLLVCSDAIQSAIQDVNKRYKRSLKPEIFAPNTAGGASKYNDKVQGRWGNTPVANRHRRLDGSIDKNWMNFHVYNYQKYSSRQFDADKRSGFLTDYHALRESIDADMPGEPRLPMSLTEFNIQTAANYDRSDDNTNTPFDSSSLGATLAGLSAGGMEQMYLFKFGQTTWKSKYGVKKNGTHYVQNSSPYNYGGATRCAESYRLFIKAARGARPIHRVTASTGASPGLNKGLWNLATQDEATGMSHLFLANRDDRTIPLDIDFSALGIPFENPFCIEQVDKTKLGGLVTHSRLKMGKTGSLVMPPLSVWLISLPTGIATTITRDAVADTQLRDGAKLAVADGGSLDSIMVRSDASKNPRHVALIRIPVPTGANSKPQRVILEVDVASSLDKTMAQAHVYGIENNNWSEDSLTWKQAGDFLKSGVPVGNEINNNVVNGHGRAAHMLGQLAADSSATVRMALDVTDFACTRKDGMATFLIVQEHRWDIALPSLARGDTQSAHLRIGSRERQGRQSPRLIAFVSGQGPAIEDQSQSSQIQKNRR